MECAEIQSLYSSERDHVLFLFSEVFALLARQSALEREAWETGAAPSTRVINARMDGALRPGLTRLA